MFYSNYIFIVWKNNNRHIYTNKYTKPISPSAGDLEATTPHSNKQTHVPIEIFNTILCQKEPGLLGEMTDSGAKQGNIEAEPAAPFSVRN